jgi:hypothetical protein
MHLTGGPTPMYRRDTAIITACTDVVFIQNVLAFLQFIFQARRVSRI